jgi:zinc protease
LSDDVSFEELDQALWPLFDDIKNELMSEAETSKLLNKIRTVKEFQEQGLLNRAMNLCIYELLGDANGVNEENNLYQSITAEQIKVVANQLFKKENTSLLRVKSIKE